MSVVNTDFFVMPKNRSQKQETIDSIASAVERAKMVVFTDFKGLKVKEITELRRELSGINSDSAVVKKTLMNLAFQKVGLNFDPKILNGNIVALTFDYGEELAPIKSIAQFAKTHEKIALLGGIWNKTFITSAEVKAIAALPSKKELLAKMFRCLQSPLSGFVNVLSGNLRGFVHIIGARREALEKTLV